MRQFSKESRKQKTVNRKRRGRKSKSTIFICIIYAKANCYFHYNQAQEKQLQANTPNMCSWILHIVHKRILYCTVSNNCSWNGKFEQISFTTILSIAHCIRKIKYRHYYVFVVLPFLYSLPFETQQQQKCFVLM